MSVRTGVKAYMGLRKGPSSYWPVPNLDYLSIFRLCSCISVSFFPCFSRRFSSAQ